MIYLDNAASTAVDPRVQAAMQPYFAAIAGNPSSMHRAGQQARAAIERARLSLGSFFQCDPTSFVFTTGGTESNNLAIKGVAEVYLEKHGRPGRIIVSAIEHESVLAPCAWLAKQGWDIVQLPVNKKGLARLDDLAATLTPNTALVSIMAANNEVGSIQPWRELGGLVRERGVPFHVDATQALFNEIFSLTADPIDLLTLSSHKIYGPKGVGALYVRRGVVLRPQLHGSDQELGRRSGTENVPGIVGLGEAISILQEERHKLAAQFCRWRNYLLKEIPLLVPDVTILGPGPKSVKRLPHVMCFLIKNVDHNLLIARLDLAGIAASSGSACAAGTINPSHVLTALDSQSKNAAPLRLSLGRFNLTAEIKRVPKIIAQTIITLRSNQPLKPDQHQRAGTSLKIFATL